MHYKFILFLVIMVSSCNIPVVEMPEKQIEEPAIPEIKEIMMTILPIEQYDAYAVDEQNRVFGLTNDRKPLPIALKDSEDKTHTFNDFYKKNGKIFFSVVIMEGGDLEADPPIQPEPVKHYYVQTGSELSETEEGLYPLIPEPTPVTMSEAPFQIVINGEYSEVMRDTLRTGFTQIDGYFCTPDGLWFSVTETLSIRKKGVYFYPLSQNLPVNPVMSGRVW